MPMELYFNLANLRAEKNQVLREFELASVGSKLDSEYRQ
jgi:hypothetical protein